MINYHFLKNFVRVLKKNWIINSINIIGLSVGMVSTLLVAKYIGYSLLFNNGYENRQSIYHISQTEIQNGNIVFDGNSSYQGVGITSLAEIPEVINLTLYSWHSEELVYVVKDGRLDRSFNQTGIFSVDSTFTQMLNLALVAGDLEGALSKPGSVIITRSIAKKYFDESNPIGKTIRSRTSWASDRTWIVTAVVEDPPKNSALRFKILVSILRNTEDLWQNPVYNQYIQLASNAEPQEVTDKITGLLNQMPMFRENEKKISVVLDPLTPGFSNFEIILISTGALILILSWISFANLSIIQFMQRQQEMFIRRSFGATNTLLVRQYLTEVVMVIFTAVVVSFAFLLLSYDFFTELTQYHLLPLASNSYQINTIFIVLFLFGSLLPSAYIMGTVLAKSQATVKGGTDFRFNTGAGKRRLLAGLQFGVAIFMICFTYIMSMQMNYLQEKSLGVSLEDKLVVKPPKDIRRGKGRRTRTFRSELSKLSWINSISSSSTIPGQPYRQEVNFSVFGSSNPVLLFVNEVNHRFLDAYEVEILVGNNFPPKGGQSNQNKVVINDISMKLLGLDLSNAIGSQVVDEYSQTFTVIGVVGNYHKTSPKEEIGPMIFQFNAIRGYLTVAYSEEFGLSDEKMDEVEAIWQKVYPGQPFEFFPITTYYYNQFNGEEQLLDVMKVFSVIAIFLACFSLIGLSLFETSNSKLEVGVRKSLGASSSSIFFLFSGKYLKLFLLVTVVFSPVVYYLGSEWLGEFSYRIDLNPVSMILPIVGLVMVALTTIGFQVYKISRVDPVKILREK